MRKREVRREGVRGNKRERRGGGRVDSLKGSLCMLHLLCYFPNKLLKVDQQVWVGASQTPPQGDNTVPEGVERKREKERKRERERERE